MSPNQTEDQARRALTNASGGPAADSTAKDAPKPEDRHIETPYARRVPPLEEGEKHDHLAEKAAVSEDRQEALLDEAIEETFPSSDPISPKHIT